MEKVDFTSECSQLPNLTFEISLLNNAAQRSFAPTDHIKISMELERRSGVEVSDFDETFEIGALA